MTNRTLLIIEVLALTCFIFSLSTCKKDPCLDLAKLELLRQELVSWYVDTTQTQFQVVDRNGISQSFTMISHYYRQTEKVIDDNCGNTYGSFDLTVDYKTSVSPLNFTVKIYGSGNPSDGFFVSVNCIKFLGIWISRTAEYDLETDHSRTDEAEINYIIGDSIYGDMLEIIFKNTSLPTEIEKIYFAKQFGIIRFVDNQGNTFSRIRLISH